MSRGPEPGDRSSEDADWTAYLDDLEAALSDLGHAATAALPEPGGLGPVPPELAGRASRVLARLQAAEAVARARRGEVAARLATQAPAAPPARHWA